MLADEGERQEAPLGCPHTATAYASLQVKITSQDYDNLDLYSLTKGGQD